MPKAKATLKQLRKSVREVLVMSPGFTIQALPLAKMVDELLPLNEVDELEVLQAIEWNFGKGFIQSLEDEDSGEKEWSITASGQAKERVK